MATTKKKSGLGLSEHDEPIVVDNGPVRIDFGRKKEPTHSGDVWTRPCMPLRRLIVMRFDREGRVPSPIVHDLSPSHAVTFTLKQRSVIISVKFVPQSDEVIHMSPAGEFEQETIRHRLKPKRGRELRIARIEGLDSNRNKIDERFGMTDMRVTAVLVPFPDTRKLRSRIR
jgi:hypothetical protein